MTSAFVVVAAKAGRRVPPELVERLAAEQPPLLFEPVTETSWSNPQGTVLVRAWEAPQPEFGVVSHWADGADGVDAAADGVDGVTGFTGHMWSRRTRWQIGSWSKELAALCRSSEPRTVIEQLAGTYSLVHLDQFGRGWLGGDPLGLTLLYEGEATEFSVYASRADVAAWAITPAGRVAERDPMGSAWLAYSGYFVGDRTGYTNVRTVPNGIYVDVSPDHGAQRRTWSPLPWMDEPDVQSDEAIVDAVRASIAEDLHTMAGRLPATEHTTGLTGGKDSRLILAVALGEGIADEFMFRTRGQPALPDVVIARQIAERFGLPHEWGFPKPAASQVPYVDRLRSLVRDTSGMLNIWDEVRRDPPDGTLEVTGLCGEVMRTNYLRTGDLKSHEELVRRFRDGWKFGGLGLLRPEVHASVERDALASMFDDASGRMSAVDLVDSWYIRNRLRRWAGTAQEIGSPRVFPLYSLTAARAAFAIGPTRRRAEFLHKAVIDASCPELVDWAFAGPGWPVPAEGQPTAGRGAARRTKAGGRPPGSTGAENPPRPQPLKGATANQQHQDRTLALKRQLFEDVLVGDEANPVFEIVDRQRVCDAVEHIEELEARERLQLWGAATAAIWLGHHEDA